MNNQIKHLTIELKTDPTSPIPLYLQVKGLMKREILAGKFKGSGRLPSTKLLGKRNLLSYITVERAYWQLQKEGLITRKKGEGYYVGEGQCGAASAAPFGSSDR